MGPVVRNDIGIAAQSVRPAHGARFQGEQTPALHFPSRRKDRGGCNSAGCANNRSRCATSRRFLSRTPGTAILMNNDFRFFAIAPFCRDISCFGEPVVLYCAVSEFGFRVWKPQFLCSVAFADRVQRFRPKFDIGKLACIAWSCGFSPNLYLVAQEGGGGCTGAPKIVENMAPDQHLGGDPERIPADGTAAKKIDRRGGQDPPCRSERRRQPR